MTVWPSSAGWNIVSANAGICSYGRLDEMAEQPWQDVIDTNLTGVWHAAKAAIPHLKAGGHGGSIILTSSDAGLMAMENIGHYVAAKHGVIGLMRTLALELAADFIRVNAICPTVVNTPMVRNEPSYRLFRPDLEHPGSDDLNDVLLGLNALLFLASDEARYITGVPLPVDAGAVIK